LCVAAIGCIFNAAFSMPDYSSNAYRLMSRAGLTVEQVVQATGLNPRTVKGILNGTIAKPHARTLHRLAAGLGADTDELFQNPSVLAYRSFDRQTNPAVEEAIESEPDLFDGWTNADFDELYSRFGTGGGLTKEGAREAARLMNHNREVQHKVAVLLETSEGPLLANIVDVLYQRVIVNGAADIHGPMSPRPGSSATPVQPKEP
jgi:transcriptional regulator with XRE-family HTH domain